MADRKEKMEGRRMQILEHLRQCGRVSVAQLSKDLGTTEVTIRSDLTAMEKDGVLMRVQGGAVLYPSGRSSALTDCPMANEAQKRLIGSAVAELIKDGDTLFINCGTTTVCVAEALTNRRNLNIVTNSVAVAKALADVPTMRVLLLGGEYNAQYGFTYGANAQEQLSQYQAGWAVLAVDGVSATGGITTYHAEEAILDRMMIDGAVHALIVADSTKLGRTGFSRVCECSSKLTLITDGAEDVESGWQLSSCGMKINYV